MTPRAKCYYCGEVVKRTDQNHTDRTIVEGNVVRVWHNKCAPTYTTTLFTKR